MQDLSKDILVSVRDLTVTFNVPRGILVAVDGVDLDIKRGEILALAGESGCGKTVLAHALLNIVDPNGEIKNGKVLFENDVDVLSLPEEELRKFRWKKIAVVFQAAQNSLNPVMRTYEHATDTTLAHEKASKEEIYKRFSELLEWVRLEPERITGLYPHEASGGMKQRIIAAISFLLKPELIILDEPTSALDVLTQAFILRFLRDLHRDTGLTMLYITHDLATIAEVAERVAIMYLGNIVEIGSVEQIFYEPQHPYTEALIKAIPSLVGDVSDIKPLPGPIPDPMSPPPGCKFHPRCAFAAERCAKLFPELFDIGRGRMLACHRAVE